MFNGVGKYIGRCENTNDGGLYDTAGGRETQINVLYWTLGEWDKIVDFFNVTFKTTVKNRLFRFPNEECGIESRQ